jgi:hypothetical protein
MMGWGEAVNEDGTRTDMDTATDRDNKKVY